MITKPQSSLIWNLNDMYQAFNMNYDQVLGAVTYIPSINKNLSTIENQITANGAKGLR